MDQLFSMQAHEVIAMWLTPWYGKMIAFILLSFTFGPLIALFCGAQNKEDAPAPATTSDPETYVTYAHRAEPNGYRFMQPANYQLPSWAVNVRTESPLYDDE